MIICYDGLFDSDSFVSAEHMELMASWSINVYPVQTLAVPESSGTAKGPVAIWRGWSNTELEKIPVMKKGKIVKDKDGKPVFWNRARVHLLFVTKFRADESRLVDFFMNTLKLTTYVAHQYEGDIIVSTDHGSHDVLYVGCPSYQVTCCIVIGFELIKPIQYMSIYCMCSRFRCHGTYCLTRTWPPSAFRSLRT